MGRPKYNKEKDPKYKELLKEIEAKGQSYKRRRDSIISENRKRSKSKQMIPVPPE
jgi:hypothetical protein